MVEKLRTGVIGCGIIGKTHIRRYQEMREDVEVLAVADINEAEARRVAQENGIPHVFTDYKELLAVEEIDAVDVCLPNFLHAPVTIDALNAGKHVFCEKPMAITAQEAEAMVAAAKKNGKHLAVQMASLFQREAKVAKKLIEEGALGRVYYASASHFRRRGRVYVDGYATPHFVQKDKAGGGTLADTGIYHIARMVWFLDNPPVETVTASTFQEIPMDEKRRQESGYSVEEFGVGFVRFQGDITLTIEEAWAAHMDGGTGDRVFGSHGGLRLEPFTFFTSLYDMDGNVTFDLGAYERRMVSLGYWPARGYNSPQEHFVWSVLGRVEPIDTAGIGVTVVRITEAMYRSAETRQEISFV
ncbi:MAG: oxidoreductase [Candidatus Poribacteria bacterium]|nr:MAG: oxidoreductase [Candidatus Poribacteria bacterium]